MNASDNNETYRYGITTDVGKTLTVKVHMRIKCVMLVKTTMGQWVRCTCTHMVIIDYLA